MAVYTTNYADKEKKVERARGLSVEIIDVDSGYGYQILHNNRILIQQDFIPGIQGKTAFSSSAEAKRVADLVVSKLAHNQSPEVFLSELEALQITALNGR